METHFAAYVTKKLYKYIYRLELVPILVFLGIDDKVIY